MYINLVLFAFWFAFSFALFLVRWLRPDTRIGQLEVLGVSAGWIAILLALYNLLRFLRYYSLRNRGGDSVIWRHRRPTKLDLMEYDPSLDFSNPSRAAPYPKEADKKPGFSEKPGF